MVFEVTLGNAITVLALLVMGAWAMAKVIARIYERRSVERFESAEEQLAHLHTGMEQVSKRLAAVEITLKDADSITNINTVYNALTSDTKAYIPSKYVTALEQYVARIAELKAEAAAASSSSSTSTGTSTGSTTDTTTNTATTSTTET